MTKINVKQISKAEKIVVWVDRVVNTFKLGRKLFILNGHDPIRYVDLATNKIHQYNGPTPFSYVYHFKEGEDNDNKSKRTIS